MKACPACGCYSRVSDAACPHCGASISRRASRAAAAALLGLAIGANGACFQSKYGVPDTGGQAEYGVPDTGECRDEDEDGWCPEDGDCDDDDAQVHPDADETAGDGIDSNCDGEDDT